MVFFIMELERIKNKRNVLIIDKAYPISDEESKSLTPYSFTLTNTCDSEENYYINLEKITNAQKKP